MQVGLVALQQCGDRPQQLTERQVAVAGPDEGRLDRVGGPRAPEAALLAEHDRLRVLGAGPADPPSSTPSPNYQAADRFAPASLRPFLYDTAVNPHWIGKTDAFWYAFRTSEGTNYYRVNPRVGSREPLFDRDKLATLLSADAQKPLEPALLPITRLVINEEGTKVRFVFEEFRYEYDLATEADAVEASAGPTADYGGHVEFGTSRRAPAASSSSRREPSP